MPTGFPRAVIYNAHAECHLTVVVRHDGGFFKYFCADHGTEERLPLEKLEAFKQWVAADPLMQTVSWLEVIDDGC